MRHVKPPSSTMYALRCQPLGCRFFPPLSHTTEAGLVHRYRLRGTPASPRSCGFNNSHTSPDFECKHREAFGTGVETRSKPPYQDRRSIRRMGRASPPAWCRSLHTAVATSLVGLRFLNNPLYGLMLLLAVLVP
jgi:hypothetical protein